PAWACAVVASWPSSGGSLQAPATLAIHNSWTPFTPRESRVWPAAPGVHSGAVKVATAFVIEPMRVEHIPAVSAIERLSFPQPWPQNAYRREIQENPTAHYIVARDLRRLEEAPPE